MSVPPSTSELPESWTVPVLSCAESQSFEKALFEGDVRREKEAMFAAGKALAQGVLKDWHDLYPGAVRRMLLLVGKGHNGGDALIAASVLRRRWEGVTVEAIFLRPPDALDPELRSLWEGMDGRARVVASAEDAEAAVAEVFSAGGVDLWLDGLLGMQCRPPLREPVKSLIEALERRAAEVRMRVAVDLPSGVGDAMDEAPLPADLTYATGILKRPLLHSQAAVVSGRLRFLDLDFFKQKVKPETAEPLHLLTLEALRGLVGPGDPGADKRAHGALFVAGGSRSMPGAMLMAAEAALRTGAGLVTGLVPQSVIAPGASRLPEAMWMAVEESESGSPLFPPASEIPALQRCAAGVIGPGIGTDSKCLESVREFLHSWPGHGVIDADALRPEVVNKLPFRENRVLVLTPHLGEWQRLCGHSPESDPVPGLLEYSQSHPDRMVVLKGPPVTRIAYRGRVYHSLAGGPALGRGGSGDILAGMMGAALARAPDRPLEAVATAVLWHGRAGEELERRQGSRAVRTTDLFRWIGWLATPGNAGAG